MDYNKWHFNFFSRNFVMWDNIVKQYKIPESCGKQLLVHGEESTYYSVLRITRVSAHSQMDRNLSDSLLFRNGDSSGHSYRIFARNAGYGNIVTKGQKDPRLTVKAHVFNSTYDDDQKSSLILTMTIRHRHTPTTFTSIQLTMTRKNRHTPTTFNYRYSRSLTKEICNRRESRYRRKGIPGMGEGVGRLVLVCGKSTQVCI